MPSRKQTECETRFSLGRAEALSGSEAHSLYVGSAQWSDARLPRKEADLSEAHPPRLPMQWTGVHQGTVAELRAGAAGRAGELAHKRGPCTDLRRERDNGLVSKTH